MKPGRVASKDAYGIRIDGERFQLDGQPPPAMPTKAWGVPLVMVAKANEAAAEQAWNELADSLDE